MFEVVSQFFFGENGLDLFQFNLICMLYLDKRCDAVLYNKQT